LNVSRREVVTVSLPAFQHALTIHKTIVATQNPLKETPEPSCFSIAAAVTKAALSQWKNAPQSSTKRQ
jgi:hypothetical protein